MLSFIAILWLASSGVQLVASDISNVFSGVAQTLGSAAGGVNDLSTGDIPPLVQLKVLSETFTDSEKQFTTPGAISRKVGTNVTRTITVSAKDSISIDGGVSTRV